MKKVKFLSLSLLMLLSAVMFTGCEKDNPTENPAITVPDKGELNQNVFADETGTKDGGVTFTTSGAWTSSISETQVGTKSLSTGASADPEWISISPDHGDKAGNYTISISLEPNLTGSDRAAAITISCNATDITIAVTQKGVKEDGTKPVAKQTVAFEVYSCNAQWLPENNIPYIAAAGAEIRVYKDGTEAGQYTANDEGQVAVELEPGEYAYRVAKGNESNVPGDAMGFIIAGIFTSQEEIDNSPSQSGAQPGGLKYVDINGDGIINNDDRAENGRVSLHVDADNVGMQVKSYIAPDGFTPVYSAVAYAELVASMKEKYSKMLSQAWQIDAAMTHEASLPSLGSYANFTFNMTSSQIKNLWDAAYSTIITVNNVMKRVDEMNGITEAERLEYRGGAQYYRAHAYSVLLNYFGGVPLITATTPQGNEARNSEEEVRDFIMQDCDAAYSLLPSSSGIRYAAQQIKARLLLNIPDYAGAANASRAIIDAGMYRLPPNLEWGGDAISEGISYSTADFPSVMRKGDGTVYPARYAETLLLHAEASLSLGNSSGASDIVNMFAMAQGQAPILPPGATTDEIRSAITSLCSSQLNKEGCAFARLKRIGKFMEALGQYGAQSKHLLLPIPQYAIDTNSNMVQNPGW